MRTTDTASFTTFILLLLWYLLNSNYFYLFILHFFLAALCFFSLRSVFFPETIFPNTFNGPYSLSAKNYGHTENYTKFTHPRFPHMFLSLFGLQKNHQYFWDLLRYGDGILQNYNTAEPEFAACRWGLLCVLYSD